MYQQFKTRLLDITSLTLTTFSDKNSAMQWNGQGLADVKIRHQFDENKEIIIFDERGYFTFSASQKTVPFFNHFKFIFELNKIHFYHERFGEQYAVYLFDLYKKENGLFESMNPHLCGDDNYHASFRYDDHNILLQWNINGPKKKEQLFYYYS